MKNTYKLILVGILLFSATILVTGLYFKDIYTKCSNVTQVAGENNLEACTDTNLMFDKLPPYIKENDFALNLLRKECSYVTDSFQQDIDNDGKEETFIQTTNLFCGSASCKDRTLYIVEGNQVIFNQTGYDLSFKTTGNKEEFKVVEQLRLWNDSPCCSQYTITTKYHYDSKENLLFKPVDVVLKKKQ